MIANGHTMKAVYNSIGQMVAEKLFETETAATSSAAPVAYYKYVYDGDNNIVRSIDFCGKKEYNYEYEEGRIVRATEADIELNGEIVTSKVISNTIKYYYDTEGKMTKKVIKLMKSLNLRGKQSKNGKYRSYKGEVGRVADNLLKRDFHADKPFEKTDYRHYRIQDW